MTEREIAVREFDGESCKLIKKGKLGHIESYERVDPLNELLIYFLVSDSYSLFPLSLLDTSRRRSSPCQRRASEEASENGRRARVVAEVRSGSASGGVGRPNK